MLRTFRSMLAGGLAHIGILAGLVADGGRPLALALLCLLGLPLANAHADKIHLRTGETIKGKLIPDPTVKGRVLLYTETGKTPMTLSNAQVTSVEPEPSLLDEYAARRARPLVTAQEDVDLGDWCASKGLKDLAAGHYEAALKKDPKLDAAHEKLGHVFHKNQWLTREQARSAAGLVYYRGKWIIPEEYEQKKQQETATAEQVSWQRRLTALLRSYRAGPENRRNDVELQLREIQDASAVTPINRTFGAAPEPEIRTLAARALAAIPAPEAAVGLVDRFLAETDQEVRESTIAELSKRDEPAVFRRLTTALRDKRPEILNRAAWALGKLNAVETVPNLIAALLSVEERMIWVDPGVQGQGMAMGTPAPTTGYNFSGGRNIPILTGPAVGPGVVAYGATSLPPVQFASGMAAASLGSGLSVGSPYRGPVPKLETFTRRNTEALAALKSLTGKDFGYDVSAWNQWLRQSYHPDPIPVRRVPQP